MSKDMVSKSSLQDLIATMPENFTKQEFYGKLESFINLKKREGAENGSPVESDNDTLHIGLCMAGAVSAGAYTAGMMDYLIETLERWETARIAGASAIPQHKIVIDVMAGTSAGGMTAAIAAAAMQCEFPHVNFENYKDEAITENNKLYNSWVNLTGDKDMLDRLLDSSDINIDTDAASHRASSLLNSSFIDTIATDVLLNATCDTERPYISKQLDIWLALSNMNGIRHDLDFHAMPNSAGKPLDRKKPRQGDGAYTSYNFRDFVHFRVTTKNTPSYIQQIDFNQKNHEGTVLLRDAAMATGAFPIGLRARAFKRPRKLILRNPLYKLLYGFYVDDDLIRPDDTYIITDGGMMNNEPFEVTRILLQLALSNNTEHNKLERIISEKSDGRRAELAAKSKEISKSVPDHFTKQELYDVINETEELRVKTWDHSSHEKFTRTVILIDPFPSGSGETKNTEKSSHSRTQITEIAKGLFNAATGQLLFKVDDIEEALDVDNFSRFLIVPKRRLPTKDGTLDAMGSSAIACGAMGGFSGFFCKEYRVHDYLLGRRNCQRFLQDRFMVPAETTNPIFVNGYRNDSCRKEFTKVINGRSYLPIIPDINPESLSPNIKVEKKFHWPNQANLAGSFDLYRYLSSHNKAIANRLSLVVKDLVFQQMDLNRISRQYLALPFRWPFKYVLSKKIIKTMLEKMEKHYLM
ncbi:MAG: patatin-like phospholipase family protein [Chitinophagaceae bacterium]